MSSSFMLVRAIDYVFQAVYMLVIVRILMSWFRPQSFNRQTQWFFRLNEVVWRLTEPLLEPIRRILPTSGVGLDFSPIVLFLILSLIRSGLKSLFF